MQVSNNLAQQRIGTAGKSEATQTQSSLTIPLACVFAQQQVEVLQANGQ
jgi:hypothetical protein